MNETIVASDLTKSYKEVHALAELSLAVPEGSVLGLLGPNGAGKTTAVRILTTLLRPDSGSAVVAGVDVLADPAEARRKIGVSGQYAAVDENLTGFENLDMVGRLYHLGAKRLAKRARELLEQFDLADAGDRPAKTYSGGMRRRLDLAGALVARPPVLFLDEPTTGLDPRSRTDLWEVIGDLVAGRHDAAAHHPVPRGGRAARRQHPRHRPRHGDRRGHRRRAEGQGRRRAPRARRRPTKPRSRRSCRRIATSDRTARPSTAGGSACPSPPGPKALMEAVRRLDELDIELHDVGLRRPTLDDVFLALTGHGAEDEPTRPTRRGQR